MNALLQRSTPTPSINVLPLDFSLTQRHIATEPIEAHSRRRDDVRMMVSIGDETPIHSHFTSLADHLEPGDLIVVNTSGTRPAAIDANIDGKPLVIHVSTQLPGGLWMVEPRRRLANGATEPLALAPEPHVAVLTNGTARTDGTVLHLLRPSPGSQRLWLAMVNDDVSLPAVLNERGRPIRYSYVPTDWPIEMYQTIFATQQASAEMPSAARPFTGEVVTSLVRRGVGVATITLHTGVSSLEGHEMPYPEQFEVSPWASAAINTTRANGGRIVAVGTTVVRAIESAADSHGVVHPMNGWTDTIITPERGVWGIDGLISGWHEPGASHLAMLEAVIGRDAITAAYNEAFANGYRWHEFGDSHLMLAETKR
jgi:S-adenosylmethionine:tRNA ribosyltransferase-isomerase